MDWFLYYRGLRHEIVKTNFRLNGQKHLIYWEFKFFWSLQIESFTNFALILPKYIIFIRMTLIKTFPSYPSILKKARKTRVALKISFQLVELDYS